MPIFKKCERLFKQEKWNQLINPDGERFLKLRSLSRSKYLKKLLHQHGFCVNDMKVNDQLPTAYCSDISTDEIERFIKSEYQAERKLRIQSEPNIINELYKLKVFDWGGLHQNSLEKTIVDNYVKKISVYDKIEGAIDNELQNSLRGYVLNSWYNHWASILIEDLFKDHIRILPVLGLIKKIDFFIDNKPFDLKVTYLPEGYISYQRKLKNLKPELTCLKQEAKTQGLPIDTTLPASKQLENLWLKIEEQSATNTIVGDLKEFRHSVVSDIELDSADLIKWLYENQGVRRFDASNRFFIVLVNTQNFFEGWKMKRSIPLIKKMAKNYLDQHKVIGKEGLFEWDGTKYSCLSDVLVIKND